MSLRVPREVVQYIKTLRNFEIPRKAPTNNPLNIEKVVQLCVIHYNLTLQKNLIYIYIQKHTHTLQCSYSGRQEAKATKFYTMVPNISGFPFWRLKFSDRS
jgi:hypothetical protein